MGKLRRLFATLGLALTLALTGGTVAAVAAPAPASAAVAVDTVATPAIVAGPVKPKTYTDSGWYFHYNCMPYPSGAFMWRWYNWWERTFLNKPEKELVWKYNFYRYC